MAENRTCKGDYETVRQFPDQEWHLARMHVPAHCRAGRPTVRVHLGAREQQKRKSAVTRTGCAMTDLIYLLRKDLYTTAPATITLDE